MSCTTYSVLTAQPARAPAHSKWPRLVGLLRTLFVAFHEALQMRRDAYRRYRLSDQ